MAAQIKNGLFCLLPEITLAVGGCVLSSGVSIFKLGTGKILKCLKCQQLMSRTTSSLCLWSVSVEQVLVVAVIACLGPWGGFGFRQGRNWS